MCRIVARIIGSSLDFLTYQFVRAA